MSNALMLVPPHPDPSPIDPDLLAALRGSHHLRHMADSKYAPFWKLIVEAYDRVDELYIIDEVKKIDLWLEANPGRHSHSASGWKKRISNWFAKAETEALRRAAQKAAIHRQSQRPPYRR